MALFGEFVYCEHCRRMINVETATKTASWYRCTEGCKCFNDLVCGCGRVSASAGESTPADASPVAVTVRSGLAHD